MDRGSPSRPHHGQAAHRGSQPMTLLGGGLKAEPFSQDTGSRTPGQPGQNFLGNAPPSETPCPPPPQRSAPHHGPRALTLFSSLHPSSFTGVSPSNPLAHLIPSWPLLLGGSIRCHNLVDVFFAAKMLRNYKPNMVETLVRRHVPLAQPLPTSRSTPGQAPQHPSPLSGPHSWALGSSPLVPKCYPHFSPSPHRWGRAHACPFAPVLGY